VYNGHGERVQFLFLTDGLSLKRYLVSGYRIVLKKSVDSNWVILRVLFLNCRGWTKYYCVAHKRERTFDEI
jgi:hypothetical protein